MAKFESTPFTDTRVCLDGNEYVGCHFLRCELVFCGGEIPRMVGNTIIDCAWTFDGAAASTLQFMRGMHQGMGSLGRQVIKNTCDAIRGKRVRGVISH